MQMFRNTLHSAVIIGLYAVASQRAMAAPPHPTTAPTTAPTTTSAPSSKPAADAAQAKTEPKTIPMSFNNAPLAEISKFLADQMGKPVMVSKEIANVQITVMNPKQLPVAEAMYVLTATLHEAGVAIEERPKTVHLIPITQIAQAQLPRIGPENDMNTIEPANQIVRKTFLLRYYDAGKLVEVVKPLLPNWSYITADPASSQLIVVSTVERLRVIAGIIQQLDAPDVSGGELRVFTIKHADINDILPMLEKLISSYLGVEVKAVSSSGTGGGARPSGGQPSSPDPRMMMMESRMGQDRQSGPPSASPPPGGATVVKAEKAPVLIIPEPRRSAIVVVAPKNVLAQVEIWLTHLDQPQMPSTQQEFAEVKYVDPDELVPQLTAMLANFPDESLRSGVKVVPFGSSRKILIVGSEQNRTLIKLLLKDIDVPAGISETKTFTLKNADAQQIADNVKELFQDQSNNNYRYYFYGGDRGRGNDRAKITVTSNTRSNSVTVVAPPERMAKIAEQIEEWDKPLEGEEAAPRIFELKFADPDKTKTLLESLFTKKESSTNWRPWWDEAEPKTASPVGRLFGQFRFEAYPETGKLIVVSKNEENYAVIEKMIAEIDRPQDVGVPRIIQLKFADAETLAEQLNALLNAPGTPATILRRGQTGTFQELTDRESPYSSNNGGTNQNRPQQQQQQQQRNPGEINFWWQHPPTDLIKVRQPSNLVGKLRIVPNVEQNLLMVVAPEEYAAAIEKFVSDLDRPGQQVLVKGVIAEITHDDTTSLGYRFSTDPTAFTTGSDANITENALRGLLNYKFEDMFGHQNTLTFNMDVNNLISLLHRVTGLKIRSEPKVFTADNVEAEFFDGQDIPFIKDSNINGINGQSQSFDYKAVGIRLRVRPHITKERNIDLTTNLLISSVIPGRTLFGGAIVDRRETTTRIVLEDGKTFLISGILREEDRQIIRSIPGVGDIPVLGEVFKHRETAKVNTEILIFLTPYVIGPKDSHGPIESEPLQRLEEQMGNNDEFGPGREPHHKHPATCPADNDAEHG